MRGLGLFVLFAAAGCSSLGQESGPRLVGDPLRRPIPGSSFPIAESVAVPTGSDLLFVSGAVPARQIEGGASSDPATFGDTETQTRSVLKAVEERLLRAGYRRKDVVMMRVYLAADPALGRMDFAGFMRAYGEVYDTGAEANLPARSVVEVAGLAVGGWLVEIEVVAARAPAAAP